MHMLGEYDEEDRELLNRAARWLRGVGPAELQGDWPRKLAHERGIDFATAALYAHVCSERCVANLFDDNAALRGNDSALRALRDLTVAVAPGAFYREHPATGADGSAILATATALGCHAAMIPTASVGTLSENANTIISWLSRQNDKRIVLVALSKGAADVKAALAHPEATAPFKHVIAWINVGGILDGSPMVAWLLERPLPTLIYRFLFWRRGRDFQFIRDMDRKPGGALDFELGWPPQTPIIHVVGFPLRRHLRDRRAVVWHRRLSRWGPNDGAAILADSCKLPGDVVPVWGADHFSKYRINLPELVARLLTTIALGTRALRAETTSDEPALIAAVLP